MLHCDGVVNNNDDALLRPVKVMDCPRKIVRGSRRREPDVHWHPNPVEKIKQVSRNAFLNSY